MVRLVRVLPLAALCLGTGAWAQAEPEAALTTPEPDRATSPAEAPVSLACPEAFEFEGRLRSLLAQSSCGVPERQVLVALRQDEVVSGTLVVLKDYQAEFVREVRGSSCAEVEAALSLALEIFLDPGQAGESACVAKQERERPADAPNDWPGQDLDPFNLPDQEPPPPPPEPFLAQPLGIVRAAFQIDTSYAPNATFGIAAAARARVTPQNFLGLTLSHQTAPPFVGGGVVHLSATAVEVSFGQFLPIGTKGEFSLQVGPRVGVLEVASSAFAGWDLVGTLAVDVTLGLGFRVGSGFWTGVQGGGVFNALRARYLDGAGIIAWEQPWAGAFVGLYFSAAVPEASRVVAGRPRG